jgi:hypothetical protein
MMLETQAEAATRDLIDKYEEIIESYKEMVAGYELHSKKYLELLLVIYALVDDDSIPEQVRSLITNAIRIIISPQQPGITQH